MSQNPFRVATPRSGRDPQARNWSFTLNNYDDQDEQRLQRFAEGSWVQYMVYGHEIARSGTLHLQGFFQSHGRLRFSQAKRLLGIERIHLEVLGMERIHLEVSRSNPSNNRDF